MGPRVSDEVWQGLNPDVGGRKRQWVQRAWLAVILAVGLWIAGNLVWIELGQPRLSVILPIDAATVQRDGDVFRQTFLVANDRRFTETIRLITLTGPGLEVLSVEGRGAGAPSPFPVTLHPGEVVGFVVAFRVTDCAAFDVRYPFPMQATVQRPWGAMTVGIGGAYESSGPHEGLVDFWCGR